MARWSKIEKGDVVELKGREYEVVKIKPKGKRAKVTVRSKAGEFKSEVLLTDKVKRVPDPLHDEDGRMRRWAKPSEVKHAAKLPPGDPTQTKPPHKAKGDPWETRRDKVERRLEELLEARLIGESLDEGGGYYVPPVDVSTIAGHVALFHNVDPSEYGIDDLFELHSLEHAQAADQSVPLAVNHWHTEKRP